MVFNDFLGKEAHYMEENAYLCRKFQEYVQISHQFVR